jgi:hypothetical protein
MKSLFAAVIVCTAAACALCQGPQRNRGDGVYQVSGSNTTGAGNSWLTVRGIGFIWDNKSDTGNRAGMFPFLEVSSETGLFNFASVKISSRLLSYPWNHWPRFGNVSAAAKFTVPGARELRTNGYGVEAAYIYNAENSFPSLGGYRVDGTGFNAEGYVTQGSVLQFKALYDLDLISRMSWLPLTVGINAGMRIPLEKEKTADAHYVLNQYLFSAGISYVGLWFDVFAEYSLEAFDNFTKPVKITGLNAPMPVNEVIDVSFAENPMYLTLGGRVRFDKGVRLYLCVPFLLSQNIGSSIDQHRVTQDERARGVNSPFDPWFAKWKLVADLSVPLVYRRTGADMVRNFLLLRHAPAERKFDIDRELRNAGVRNDTLTGNADDARKRLDDIDKRRGHVEESE